LRPAIWLAVALAVGLGLAAGCRRRSASPAQRHPAIAALRARGERLFFGPAGCASCHKLGPRGDKSRGPNLGRGDGMDAPVALRAALRRPGLPALDYLIESLVDPDAVVAPGYAGGVMIRPDQPPIGLGEDDLIALAVLLSDGGPAPDAAAITRARASIALVRKARVVRIAELRASEALKTVPWHAADPARGRIALARLGCDGCHDNPARAALGAPPLADIARRLSREQIARWIIAPPTLKMPSYAGNVSGQELADLTSVIGAAGLGPQASGLAGP
jgi:cytochrome c2